MLIRRVRRASLLALYGLFTALLPGTAHAIGLCEKGSTTYALVEIAPRAGLLAIAVESRTCSVKETGDSIAEDWRTERSVLVTDLALREQGLYAADSAKPSGAPSIDSAKPSGAPSIDSASDGDIKPAAAWQALRAQKGFLPIDQIALRPPGTAACSVERVALVGRRVVPLNDAPRQPNAFSEHRVGLRLTVKGRALPPLVLGTHALEAGEFPVWLVPLPGGLRSYAMLATCGGPLPGSLMGGETGLCYSDWEKRVALHPTLKLPASCLPAPTR